MSANSASLLLIDDDRMNRRLLGRRLELKGFSVAFAESGQQGLKLMENQPFDLVLLDMVMPEMNGLDVLRHVRRVRPAIELPIIMVTASADSQDVVEALSLGANDYITKPVDFPVALARIEAVLASKRSYQQMLDRSRYARGHANSETATLLGPQTPTEPATFPELLETLTKFAGTRVQVGAFEADGVIGEGAMGIVVKAHDPTLCRYVALKILNPQLAECPNSRQRFALEGRFAAALRHANVVSIYGVGELNGIPYLIMEYVSGRSLQEYVDVGKKFTVSGIARIGCETALGLAAAHDIRLIHRDVKPANLLVENGTGSVRIADFGLARALDQNLNISQKGLLVGTPLYMSPEQVDGKPLTPASDLFSLGSVLYTLCTGRPPFAAESMSGVLHAIAEKEPTPIRMQNPEITDGLAHVIKKLHAKNPHDRFPSAVAVAEQLAPWTE